MSEYQAEINAPFDAWLEERVCRPALEHVPRSVSPNSITLTNAAVCWLVFTGAALAPHVAPLTRLPLLVLTGALAFVSMVLDCWDGMQARRTGRTSKLGELLDHWLDAIHVPLVSAGMALMLQLPPWIVVVNHVSSAMIYNAQLVLYHQTGRFVHPPTSGAQAQLGVALSYAAFGVLFWVAPRETVWVGWGVAAFGLAATSVQLKLCWFYYQRLGGNLAGHLPLVGYGAALGGLYLLGAMDTTAFVLAVVFLSFRLSGSYVLFTIVQRRFGGNDWGVAVAIAIIAATHLLVGGAPHLLGGAGDGLTSALGYGLCAYMVLRNAWDLSRHFDTLKPAAQAATP